METLSSATPRAPRRSTAQRILRAAVAGCVPVLVLAAAPVLRADGDPVSASTALVNSSRAAAGLAPLTRHSGLDSVAGTHAHRMAERDAIFHNPNLKAEADAAGADWLLIGENVGVGPSVQAVHEAFMVSSGHRANVLHGGYNAIGVGIAIGQDGSVFVVHAFADVAPVAVPVQLEAGPSVPPVPAPQAAPPEAAVPTAVEPTAASPALRTAAPVPDLSDGPSVSDPNVLLGGVVNREIVLGT